MMKRPYVLSCCDPPKSQVATMIITATQDPTLPLDNTYGAIYIALLFTTVIYGVTLDQSFNYFQKYRRDAWYIKTAVITVVTSNTAHLFLVGSFVYHYLVTNFHNPDTLTHMTWQLPMEVMSFLLDGAVVQLYFIYRLYKLSQSKLLCIPLVILAFCQIGLGVCWIILVWPLKTFADLGQFSKIAVINSGLTTATDILITGSLCAFLHRARTGFKRSDTMINKIILFVISTGVIPALFTVLGLAFMVLSPSALIYFSIYLCVGHLYTNSLLVTLNARAIISTNDIELNQSSITPRGTRGMVVSKPRNINILMETTHEVGQEIEKNARESMGAKALIESDDDSLQKGTRHL